jgi:hypothetical protein
MRTFFVTKFLPFFRNKTATAKKSVPDKRSRILEVVIVGRLFDLGSGNLEWGESGKGLRKGRSVYE